MDTKSIFYHECPDWDFLEIDETYDEFISCNCRFPDHDDEADDIRVALLAEMEQEWEDWIELEEGYFAPTYPEEEE